MVVWWAGHIVTLLRRFTISALQKILSPQPNTQSPCMIEQSPVVPLRNNPISTPTIARQPPAANPGTMDPDNSGDGGSAAELFDDCASRLHVVSGRSVIRYILQGFVAN